MATEWYERVKKLFDEHKGSIPRVRFPSTPE